MGHKRSTSAGNEKPLPAGRGPGRPPGGGDSRQAILDAAAKVFLCDGLSASTRDIATEAGVTQAAIYHYFPGKKDLIREAAVGASRLFEPIGAQAAAADGEPEEVLRKLAERYLATFARPHVARFMATMLSAGMKMPGFLPMMAGRLQRGVVGPTIEYLERLKKEGRIGPEVDPPMMGQMLFGTCFSYMMARYVLKAPWVEDIEPDALARQIARVLVHGMAGPARSMNAEVDVAGQEGGTR